MNIKRFKVIKCHDNRIILMKKSKDLHIISGIPDTSMPQ